MASIDWWLDGAALRVSLQVPVGCDAVLDLPGGECRALGHGGHEAVVPYDGVVVVEHGA